MKTFDPEFRSLEYIIRKSKRLLLFAHNRPDADTVGANLALAEYIKNCGKQVDISCFDVFPDDLKVLVDDQFLNPNQLDIPSYDAVIACDTVDRGFDKIVGRITENQAVVLVDHHVNVAMKGDVVIIDEKYSSSSELIYLFLKLAQAKITRKMATALLMGLSFDTGGFQHPNVSPRVLEIASDLMKLGAPLAKITETIFSHQNIGALKLWGRAFEKARLNEKNGMLVTAITKEDVAECSASIDDIYQVAVILSSVPNAKFSIVLSERDNNLVRASLRSMKQHNMDVSEIAHQFGGGGHKLASGFEISGKIVETESGFRIE